MITLKAKKLKSVLEGVLFTRAEPVTLTELSRVLEEKEAVVREVIKDLQRNLDDNEDCGLQIIEVAGGYQMTTKPQIAPYLKKMYYKKDKKTNLSKAALETLAVIAYKGPVTRVEIEEIRGVKAGGVISSLLKKELIQVAGRKKAPGKPVMFKVTNKFLEHFGLNSIEELPKPKEISD